MSMYVVYSIFSLQDNNMGLFVSVSLGLIKSYITRPQIKAQKGLKPDQKALNSESFAITFHLHFKKSLIFFSIFLLISNTNIQTSLIQDTNI